MQNNQKQVEFEYFNNAPIILSIIQFRYDKLESFNHTVLRNHGEELKSKYPFVKERYIQTVHINESPSEPTRISLDEKVIDGIEFVSSDKRKVLVIARDKFTLEYHGEYKGWEDFTNEAKYLWEYFQSDISEVKLKGLSLRFVNRFNLPSTTKELAEYFTTFLTSSAGNFQFSNFQLRYTTVEESENIIYHVGHALDNLIEDKFPYIFDIDVICLKEIINEADPIWEIFTKLREKKNLIFNSSLTEKTKNLIR